MIKLITEFWSFTKTENISLLNRISLLKVFFKDITKRFSKVIRYRLHKKQYALVPRIDELNCQKNYLFIDKNRKNFINSPYIFQYNPKQLKKLEGSSQNIYVALLQKCFVVSRTSSVNDGTSIYNDTIYHMNAKHDLKYGVTQTIDSYVSKNVISYFKMTSYGDQETIYIHLLNEHSKNYYHWLYEMMPKFIQICHCINQNDHLRDKKFTILLDYNLPKQFFEILKVYATITYNIRIIKRFEMLFCPSLLFCTDFWISLDNTKFKPDIQKEFFVDQYAVSLLKRNITYFFLNKSNYPPHRRIYLERQEHQKRALINSSEVRIFLENEGFEIIYPGQYTFLEQLSFFNEAKIIIGPSGAAFSNILFMQKNTYAIIFSPKTVGANYYIFQPMADQAQINLIHILTQNNSFDESIHCSASINIKTIKDCLDSIN